MYEKTNMEYGRELNKEENCVAHQRYTLFAGVPLNEEFEFKDDFSIVETVQRAKKRGEKVVEVLQQYINVERVKI